MATSINSPNLSNAIRTDIPAINTILKAIAKSDPSVLSDIENGTKRLYQGTNGWEFQELQSGSWVTLKSFNIDAKSVDGKTLSSDATANTIALRDADGKLAGDIKGNAATATKATALASTLAVAGGGTGATTAAAARTNLGVPPTSHASTGTSYGVSTADNYGHAKASATTPKALGTASAGSETASFARGDHVHPTTTATDSVLGMVKLSDSISSTSAASAGIAASPAAVKAAYDLANTANANANSAKSATLVAKATNPVTSTAEDTPAKWVELGPGVYWFSEYCLIDQPHKYGFLINYTTGADVFQTWSSQNSGPVRFREGNASGWGITWHNNATWADSANYANSAGRAFPKKTDGGDLNMNWHDHGGHPAYLWGGDDGVNMYVFPPGRLSVNWANNADGCNWAHRLSAGRAIQVTTTAHSSDSGSTYVDGRVTVNQVTGTAWFDGTGNINVVLPSFISFSLWNDCTCNCT